MLYLLFYFMFLSSDKLKARNSLSTKEVVKDAGSNQIAAKTFIFRELAAATKNFRGDYLLGEGGFGRVYKGVIDSNQVNSHELSLLFTNMECNKKRLLCL